MAYFNPKPVTFNPSPYLNEQAGAIGDAIKNLYIENQRAKQLDLQNQREDERMRLARESFGLKQDSFEYGKERDIVEDAWRQGQADQAQANFMKNYQQKDDHFNKNFAHTKLNADRNYNFNLEKFNYGKSVDAENRAIRIAKEAEEEAKNKRLSLLYAMANPETAKKYGAIKEENEFVAPTEKEEINPVLKGLALGGKDLEKISHLFKKPSGQSVANVEQRATIDPQVAGLMRELGVKDLPPNKTKEQLNYETYAKSKSERGETPLSFDEWYEEDRLNKKMGVGATDAIAVEREKRGLAEKLGIGVGDLTRVDVTKLSGEQRSYVDAFINIADNSLRNRLKGNNIKILNDLSSVAEMSKIVSLSLRKGDSGLLDNLFNEVNKYLGWGDKMELIRTTTSRSSYAHIRNMTLRLLSGATVTGGEATRFIQEYGSLWHSDSVVATQMLNSFIALRAKITPVVNSGDRAVFNLKYGDIPRKIDFAIERMKRVVFGERGNHPQGDTFRRAGER